MAWDVFGHEEKLGKKIVVIGGGVVGCELSIALGERGHDVTVVEITPHYAATAEIADRMSLEEHMEQHNVTLLVNTQCMEITDSGVVVRGKDGSMRAITADSVILAAGSVPLAEERDAFSGTAFDVINVGDCTGPANIRNATDTGWCAGNVI